MDAIPTSSLDEMQPYADEIPCVEIYHSVEDIPQRRMTCKLLAMLF
jgi:hypothetical protein